MSNHTILIDIGDRNPAEYRAELLESLTNLQKLIFERRELTLDQDQTHALYMLTDLQDRLVQEGVGK